jgi:hypothetical protein
VQQQQPELALPAQLENEFRSLHERQATLEDGLAEVAAAQKRSQQSTISPYVSPAVSLVSVLVAAGGYLVVHNLSVRRQRRDEFFKIVQSAEGQLNEIAVDAADAWRKLGSHPEAQGVASMLPARFQRLGRQLAALRRRQSSFDVTQALADCRKAATKDLEDASRAADPARAIDVMTAANQLASAIDLAYFAIYG